MHVESHLVVPVTDGSGNATAFTPVVTGEIRQIVYIQDPTIPYSAGVDFTITVEATAENVWTEADVNASTVRAPRIATHSVAGAALLYAAGGTPVGDRIAVSKSRIKIAIAQGGAAKSGFFAVVVA